MLQISSALLKNVKVSSFVLLMLSASPARAYFDPITTGACISLASSALSLFGSNINPQAHQMDLVLTHVRSTSQRLERIEDGIVTIMEKIDQLPLQWREDMAGMINEITSQEARAYTTVLDDIISGLRDADKFRNRGQRQEMLRRLKEAVIPFKAAADALLDRSGAVAPVVIVVMIRDVWMERLFELEESTISSRLSRYDGYFANMQDENFPGSVAHVRAFFEGRRSIERKNLAKTLSGNDQVVKDKDVFHFYSVTLTETREREERRTRIRIRCNARIGDCFDSEETYIVKVPYSHPVKTIHHHFALTETALPNQTDLVRIAIDEKISEDVSSPEISLTTSDLGQLDKTYDGRRTDVRSAIERLNLLDEAIGLLRDQEAAIAMARSLIGSWDNDSALSLARQTAMLASRDIDSYRQQLDIYDARLITEARRQGILEARQIAKEAIADSEKAYSDALEEARRSSWRHEVGQLLATAQFGLQTYQTVVLLLSKFSPPLQRPRAEETPNTKENETRGKEIIDKEKRKTFKVTLERDKAAQTFALAAQQLIEESDKSPASKWVNGLPIDRPVKSEALLHQALIYLDLADKSAIAFGQGSSASGKSDAEIFRETLVSLRNGSTFNALLSVLSPATTSSQDILGGLQHRNELRRRALESMSGFIQIRTEQGRRQARPSP